MNSAQDKSIFLITQTIFCSFVSTTMSARSYQFYESIIYRGNIKPSNTVCGLDTKPSDQYIHV